MNHNVLFIGWGQPVRGRELQAAKVFSEWNELLGTLQSKGSIKSVTPVFLAPRGGELNGFFLITGEPRKLAELAQGDELRRAITRAQIVVEQVGVVSGLTGDEIMKQMQLWTSQVNELSK